MLEPAFAILDEVDSGLDIDALKIVGENINRMRGPDFGALIITHYQRFLDYVDVDYVHIMLDGRIVRSGGRELIEAIDSKGYDWLKIELGLEDARKLNRALFWGTVHLRKARSDRCEHQRHHRSR